MSREWPRSDVLVALQGVAELRGVTWGDAGVALGANVTLSQLLALLKDSRAPATAREAWRPLRRHLRRVAGAWWLRSSCPSRHIMDGPSEAYVACAE